MSLDGKLGILIVTLAALFLIYLDNAGKLYPAMGLIAGPAINDGAPATAQASLPAAPAGVAPYPVTNIVPFAPSSSSGTITTSGAIHGAGSAVTGIQAPYAPPLPSGSIVSGRIN